MKKQSKTKQNKNARQQPKNFVLFKFIVLCRIENKKDNCNTRSVTLKTIKFRPLIGKRNYDT